MKRFGYIAMVAVVVLALTAGPAFASVCAASSCSPQTVCSMATLPSCPMENGVPLMHASCSAGSSYSARDAVSSQANAELGLTGAPLVGVVVRPFAFVSIAPLAVADARGAPHLTSVIRI